MAFTEEQNETIRRDLIRAARHFGVTVGMRKTSVQQEQIGTLYPQVLETLVQGACEELFA